MAQWKADSKDRNASYFVEPARGAGRRMFIMTTNTLSIKMPIPSDVSEDDILFVMKPKLENKLLDLIDGLTEPVR